MCNPKSPGAGAFSFSVRRAACALGTAATLVLAGVWSGAAPTTAPSLRALIVGGGPDLENNQAAIESNVRYVARLLPPGTPRTVLFADGNPQRATVLYQTSAATLPPGQRVLKLLLDGYDEGQATLLYRKPNLDKIDGPASPRAIQGAFTRLSREAPALPLLLYCTGHGSDDEQSHDNNRYDLWGEDALSVRDLAGHIASLPGDVPVTVVMVQCFSGAFGNLIFEGGDPKKPLAKRDIAGFFATVKERMAAGCTPEVNEAEYHDFTSYFFAALCGRDRVGRRVAGADANGDGRTGMDEAFCYTLARDASIDVPVCTSDVFLRRFVPTQDTDVFKTLWPEVLAWATPAQRAALEALSDKMNLSGDDRLALAYRRIFGPNPVLEAIRHKASDQRAEDAYNAALDRFETLRAAGRRDLLRRWPGLRRAGQRRATAERAALAQLGREAEAGRWKALLETAATLDQLSAAENTEEVAESYRLRFVRLGKTVVLAHRLQSGTDAALKARFARLLAAEGQTLLPPAP